MSCIQWVALQTQVLVELHPVSGSADSGFGELASSEWLCRIRFLVRTSVKGQRNFQRLIWWSFQYNLSRVYQGLAVHPNVNNWGSWRLKPMKNLLFPSLSLKMFWHAKFNQWVALNLVCLNYFGITTFIQWVALNLVLHVYSLFKTVLVYQVYPVSGSELGTTRTDFGTTTFIQWVALNLVLPKKKLKHADSIQWVALELV